MAMDTVAQESNIQALASVIQRHANHVSRILSIQGLSFPSFDSHRSFSLPRELEESRLAILDATNELRDLFLNPFDLIHHYGNHNNLVCLHAIHRFDIANTFALDERVTFEHIATHCGLPESNLRRLLRHAMTFRIFHESDAGLVEHTAASKALREDPYLRDWLVTNCEEMWPAATRTVDALSKWPASEDPTKTGFSLANDTDLSMFDVFARSPARAKRFAGAMHAYTVGAGYETRKLIEDYDWKALGEGTVADVGGADGHVSMSLAQAYPSLKFVVQDLPEVIEERATNLPTDLASRVQFQPHDFFEEQNVTADLYYFRWVFHNWPDTLAIKILRALVPALKPGARILIHDNCLPELGKISLWQEQRLRAMDVSMMEIGNARERDEGEFRTLFQRSDPRFRYLGMQTTKGSSLAIIQAVWTG